MAAMVRATIFVYLITKFILKMKQFINLDEMLTSVSNCVITYFDDDALATSLIYDNPYRFMGHLASKRQRRGEKTKRSHAEVCILHYLLKSHLGIDIHWDSSSRTCYESLIALFQMEPYFFLTLLNDIAMTDNKNLTTESMNGMEAIDCGDGNCIYVSPSLAELIRQGKLSVDDIKHIRKEIANTPIEDWIENHEAMRLLGICMRKLQTLRSNGTIPYSRIGNTIYYRRQDIQKILADNYTMFEIHKNRA